MVVQKPDSDDEPVQVEDLRLSLADFLETKKEVNKAPSPPTSTPIPPAMLSFADAPSQPLPRTSTSTANSLDIKRSIDMAVVDEGHDLQPGPQDRKDSSGIPHEFLLRLQKALDDRGLTSEADVARLANGDMPKEILEALGDMKDTSSQWQADWREKQKEKERLEMEAKKKMQVPRWRCAACGRYGCTVAPYIEGYDEIDG